MKSEEFKLTPERQKVLMDNIRQGVPFSFSARLAGISETGFHRYKSTSKEIFERLQAEGRPPRTKTERWHVEFKRELDKAEAEAIYRNIGLIQIAASTDWKAAAWWLERTFPDFYSRKVITSETSEKVVERVSIVKSDEVDLSGCSVEELKVMERILSRTQKTDDGQTDLEG